MQPERQSAAHWAAVAVTVLAAVVMELAEAAMELAEAAMELAEAATLSVAMTAPAATRTLLRTR